MSRRAKLARLYKAYCIKTDTGTGLRDVSSEIEPLTAPRQSVWTLSAKINPFEHRYPYTWIIIFELERNFTITESVQKSCAFHTNYVLPCIWFFIFNYRSNDNPCNDDVPLRIAIQVSTCRYDWITPLRRINVGKLTIPTKTASSLEMRMRCALCLERQESRHPCMQPNACNTNSNRGTVVPTRRCHKCSHVIVTLWAPIGVWGTSCREQQLLDPHTSPHVIVRCVHYSKQVWGRTLVLRH